MKGDSRGRNRARRCSSVMASRLLRLGIALAALVVPPQIQAQSRSLILVVHGRGHQARDTADLRRDAVRALRAGSAALTGDSLITDDDVRLVWYADVLDARSGFSTDATTCAASNGAEESSTGVFSMLAMLAGVIVEANAVEQEKQGGDGLRGFAGDLRYLGDTRTRCAAESRLAAALAHANAERRPVTVVAHSLGALVSWGHFQRRSSANADGLPEIRRLVTLGSPLGSPGIRELVFGDARSSVRLPRSVRSWVNVVNEDDPFAVRVLAEGGVNRESAPHVVDLLTERGGENPHEMRGYLRDRATVRTIIESWCESYSGKPGRVAKACGSLPSR